MNAYFKNKLKCFETKLEDIYVKLKSITVIKDTRDPKGENLERCRTNWPDIVKKILVALLSFILSGLNYNCSGYVGAERITDSGFKKNVGAERVSDSGFTKKMSERSGFRIVKFSKNIVAERIRNL